MSSIEDSRQAAKRSDVGYKRPPAEHRFKKGQKRPPRKPKEAPAISMSDLLWRILQEERRVTIGGQVRWMRNAEIIIRNAFLLADKQHSTVQRLLSDLLMKLDKVEKEEVGMRIHIDPDATEPTGTYVRRFGPA